MTSWLHMYGTVKRVFWFTSVPATVQLTGSQSRNLNPNSSIGSTLVVKQMQQKWSGRQPIKDISTFFSVALVLLVIKVSSFLFGLVHLNAGIKTFSILLVWMSRCVHHMVFRFSQSCEFSELSTEGVCLLCTWFPSRPTCAAACDKCFNTLATGSMMVNPQECLRRNSISLQFYNKMVLCVLAGCLAFLGCCCSCLCEDVRLVSGRLPSPERTDK